MSKTRNRRRYWSVCIQLIAILWNNEVSPMTNSENNKIVISIGAVTSINPADLKTLGQYIVIDHLGRGLVKKNTEGYLEGDLLEKWEISSDGKLYNLTLKEDALWSTGEQVTAKDVSEYLNWHRVLKTSNHTNLSLVTEIKDINKRELLITFSEKHENFLNSLNNADMVLFKLKNGEIDYSVSSGAYILKDQSKEHLKLIKNNFFPFHNNSAEEIIVTNAIQNIETIEKCNFVWPINLSDEQFFESEKTHNFKKHSSNLVYTHWFSILPSSQQFKDQNERLFVSYLIRKYSREYFNQRTSLSSPADQLLWEEGIGDLPVSEVNEFWNKLEGQFEKNTTKINIKVLAGNLPHIRWIINKLEDTGHKIEVDWINNYQDRIQFMSKKNYDLVYQNNDFSEIDPYESFRVTMNPHKPYILTDNEDKQFESILNKILTISENKRRSLYEEISRKVLHKGYTGLLSRNRTYFLYKDIDLSYWSKTTPEIKFWKIPVIKNVSVKKN